MLDSGCFICKKACCILTNATKVCLEEVDYTRMFPIVNCRDATNKTERHFPYQGRGVLRHARNCPEVRYVLYGQDQMGTRRDASRFQLDKFPCCIHAVAAIVLVGLTYMSAGRHAIGLVGVPGFSSLFGRVDQEVSDLLQICLRSVLWCTCCSMPGL